MATLNFDESIVLILFAQAIGTDPTQATVIGFDAQLQKDFGERLHKIMNEEGLEIDVHNRSLVLGLRPHVGGNTPPQQIRNACKFVLEARQALSARLMAVGLTTSAKRVSPAARGATRTTGSRGTGRSARKRPRSDKRSTRKPS